MSEELIVHGAVLAAAAYIGWRVLPGTWRDALGRSGRRLAQRFGLAQAELRPPSRRPDSGYHGGCGSCTGCAHGQRPANAIMLKKIKVKELRKC